MVMVMVCGASLNAFSQVKEDCIGFNPNNVAVEQHGSNWTVVDGSHWIFAAPTPAEAKQIIAVIKRYGANQTCFVGRPDPSLTYLLKDGTAPAGAMAGEDCLSFNPGNLSIQPAGSGFRMQDGSHLMFSFPDILEAASSLFVVGKYGFTRSCFVGRPGPSLAYLRK